MKTANLSDLTYESFRGGERFAAEWADLARGLGATKLGCGLFVVPPGKASVPYHFHRVIEELAIVVEGEISVRLPAGEHTLTAGDVVSLPPGEAGAHQFINRGGVNARLLLMSDRPDHDVAGYPDSDKRLLYLSGLAGDRSMEKVILRGDEVVVGEQAYFDGEAIDDPVPDPGPSGPEDPRIAAIDDVPWTSFGSAPFGGRRRRIGRAVGAERLGCSVYEIAPGTRPFPYHLHHVNEEWFWVRAGSGSLRTPGGGIPIAAGDVFVCVPGEAGAHTFEAGDAGLEILVLSTMEAPDVCEYPDSGKVYVMVGAAPGGDAEARAIDLVFRREDAVDYYDGER